MSSSISFGKTIKLKYNLDDELLEVIFGISWALAQKGYRLAWAQNLVTTNTHHYAPLAPFFLLQQALAAHNNLSVPLTPSYKRNGFGSFLKSVVSLKLFVLGNLFKSSPRLSPFPWGVCATSILGICRGRASQRLVSRSLWSGFLPFALITIQQFRSRCHLTLYKRTGDIACCGWRCLNHLLSFNFFCVALLCPIRPLCCRISRFEIRREVWLWRTDILHVPFWGPSF